MKTDKSNKPLFGLHPLVKALIVGAVVVSIVQSMSAPYFAVYLSEHTPIRVGSIGFIVGMGALAGTFGGFVGGVISDWLGRKAVLTCSLLVLALANWGYVVARNSIVILGFILLSGFFGSFFGPTAKALMADVTAAEVRVKVFSLQYVGTNIGYAIGPLLGVAFGFLGGSIPFAITGCVYIVYICVLAILLRRFPIQSTDSSRNYRHHRRPIFSILKSDDILLTFVLGGLVICLVNGQWSTPMSVFLTHHLAHGTAIFSILLTTNAIVVIAFQPIASKVMTHLKPIQNISIGGILFSVGCMIFTLAGTGLVFVIGMVIFSLGEIFIVPSEYAIIDQITPESMRGAYYGAASLTNLGNFIGPWMFSLLLSNLNGTVMFATMAVCPILGILIYLHGWKRQNSRFSKLTTTVLPDQV